MTFSLHIADDIRRTKSQFCCPGRRVSMHNKCVVLVIGECAVFIKRGTQMAAQFIFEILNMLGLLIKIAKLALMIGEQRK